MITISPDELARSKPSAGRGGQGGNFDVVVVQTSPADVFPETRGLLTGKPVYTVYLKVGSAKEWILQYCLPNTNEATPANQGGIVVQANPTPVDAPYPVATERPSEPVDNPRYIIVHGYIDAEGSLKNLRVVGSRNAAFSGAILAALERWQFRPAQRDGQPVMVEVLLAIPPRAA